MINISILIPVYNVEKYLSHCLDSVLNQEFSGTFEVICVNDGSTDGSVEILEQYAKRYPNLKIIHQENQGLSVARNTGLDASQGEYIMFVDSDDYIVPGAIAELYDFAKKHDSEVVIFDYIRQNDKTGEEIKITNKYVYEKFGENTFNVETADKYAYYDLKVNTWCKFYLRDLIKDIKFAVGMRAQDNLHWAYVYTKAKKINYFPKVLYYYITHRDGATMMTPDISAFHFLKISHMTRDILKESPYYEKLKNCFYVRTARMCAVYLKGISKDLRKKFVDEIKDFDWDVDYAEFFNEKFRQFEKNDMRLIKFILEHNYKEICNHMEQENLWKKDYKYGVSIVIPVYNVEKYLARCLDSVVNQTFPKGKYEIICVNDNSEDKSGEILEQYAKLYPNLKIINQEHQGLSVARNTGIKASKGKYILFVDSDDIVALNALEVLYNYAEKNKSDVVVFDFYRGKPGVKNPERCHYKNIAKKYGNKQFNAKTADKFVYRFIPVAAWEKFYRHDLIKDFKFIKDIYYEDVPYWDLVYTNAKRINYLPCALYFYDNSRNNSITSTKNKKVFDIFKAFNASRKILKEYGYFEKFKYIMYAHATCNIVKHLKNVDKDLRKEFIEEIKKFEIDVSVEEFLKEDFYKFEYKNFELIKYIQQNDYDTVISYLKKYKVIS